MPSQLLHIWMLLLMLSLGLHGLGLWAAIRRTRRRTPAGVPDHFPGLSLLKPLKGLEDGFDANLTSFLEQDYPGPLQIVMCAVDAGDPGLQRAKQLAAAYPQVEVHTVVSRVELGRNPKVNNMHGGLQACAHPYVLQSDANVRLAPGYLRALMTEAMHEQADMVGSLVVGGGERGFAAALENAQLTAFVAPAVCLAQELANIPCIIGKSMLMRRAALRQVGDLSSVRNVLAEDFVLAQAFRRAGLRVHLSTLTVTNINERTTLRAFVARHGRWLKMRAVIHVPAHLVDPLGNPTLFSLLLALVGGPLSPYPWLHLAVLVYKSQCDRMIMRRLRGSAPSALAMVPITQVRDLVIGGLWLYACFSRTTVWRGERLRMGRGSVLYPVKRRWPWPRTKARRPAQPQDAAYGSTQAQSPVLRKEQRPW